MVASRAYASKEEMPTTLSTSSTTSNITTTSRQSTVRVAPPPSAANPAQMLSTILSREFWDPNLAAATRRREGCATRLQAAWRGRAERRRHFAHREALALATPRKGTLY